MPKLPRRAGPSQLSTGRKAPGTVYRENVQSPDGYGRILGQMVLLANLTAKSGQMGTISPETIWNYHFWIIIQTYI